jgi:hypothetical protein
VELLTGLAAWLESLGLRAFAGGGNYPAINSIHLLGLVMGVGAIGILDLRFAGLWRAIPIEPMARALTPIAVTGFIILIASGLLLFAADGRALAGSGTFRTKLLLIALALSNAAAFRLAYGGRLSLWEFEPPAMGRAMAVASIGLWLSVGLCGRMIAYS